MPLRIVCLSWIAHFFVIGIPPVFTYCKIQIYCLPSYEVVAFAIFIFYFLVEHGSLHDRSTYFGDCILCSIIVVCSCHSHYLYHCSCCFNCYLGYCLYYRILFSCNFRFFFCLLRNCFCETALFESAYFLTDYVEHFYLPRRDFLLLTPCSVPCLIKDNTGLCLYAYLLLHVYQSLKITFIYSATWPDGFSSTLQPYPQ